MRSSESALTRWQNPCACGCGCQTTCLRTISKSYVYGRVAVSVTNGSSAVNGHHTSFSIAHIGIKYEVSLVAGRESLFPKQKNQAFAKF